MGLFNKIFKKEEKKEPGIKETKEVEKKPAEQKAKEAVKEVEKKPKKALKEDTGIAYRVLIKPILTEKTAALTENSKYFFEVAKKADKGMIKRAILSVYGVKPVKVNIVKVKGKIFRAGKGMGRTKDWKKAIVTLKKGEKIEVFET